LTLSISFKINDVNGRYAIYYEAEYKYMKKQKISQRQYHLTGYGDPVEAFSHLAGLGWGGFN
jgi:hypothetical protein